MKKILLTIFTFLALFSPAIVRASWVMADTTITATVDSTASIYDAVIVTGSSATLTWHVVACTFPADWLTEVAFGICDNNQCYNNVGSTYLWNNATGSGTAFTSNPYFAGSGDFHVQLNLKGLSPGTHSVTVTLSDASLNTKTITFVITKPPLAVQPVTNPESNVVLYPNPATNELNVRYDASADVKNIAIYNIIGRLMTVYKLSGNNSANLNIENIPSGLYFVRLQNAHGDVVATKKFTKQ